MVEFNFLEKAPLRNRVLLKRFLPELCKMEGYTLRSLSIVFCSDDYLLEVNRTYLNHDFYTDIITFDYSDEPKVIDGELFISVDRVKENSTIYSATAERELHRVIFHGLLHLCGYKDNTRKDKEQMRLREDFHLSTYLDRST